MKRPLFALGVAVVMLGAMESVSRAESIVATLGQPGPADIISINGQGAYAGVLNWQVNAATASAPLSVGQNFGTYCIDIVHDIGVGGVYEYNIVGLGSDSFLANTYLGVSDVLAIQTLYSDAYAASLASNDLAAGFQSAVWTVLFSGVSITGLDAGASAALTADLTLLNAQMASNTFLDTYNVMAMVADPSAPTGTGPIPGYPAQGQDQGLVVMNFGSAPVPLPSTAWSGLSILGGLGVFGILRKHLARGPRVA